MKWERSSAVIGLYILATAPLGSNPRLLVYANTDGRWTLWANGVQMARGTTDGLRRAKTAGLDAARRYAHDMAGHFDVLSEQLDEMAS
jgi:hypothetical protein